MPAKTKKVANAPSTSSKPHPSSNPNPSQPNAKPAPPSSVSGKSQNGPSGPGLQSTKPSEAVEPASRSSDNSASLPTVNRKKQKRREKEAAKRAAERHAENESLAQNGYAPTIRGSARGYFREETEDFHHGYVDEAVDGDDAFFSGAEEAGYGPDDLLRDGLEQMEQVANGLAGKKKKKSKKVGQMPGLSQNYAVDASSILRKTTPLAKPQLAPTPSLSAAALRSAHQNFTHDQIWNTSTQAERENIKQFWLELGEEERRSLVKVEKEAVLRKMKEQQKHSCSCTVCGRKRTAIEEELEVLYDAYYEELEQFANHNNGLSNGAAIMPDPRAYGHLRTPRHPMAGQFPIETTGHDLMEEDEGLDDEEYDDDEEPFSDEDIEEIPRGPPDFFTFGNSLTVKDGILTVADDLLKNDGKHFIDMMESLAEKRMQRHNHPPLDEDDDFDDDEDDEDFDSQDEDDLEGDEMDAMTEEQRMEEGRRMFQIFAARMFEQRVLTAYREKVARERQRKLIEELEEENRLDTQREAKRAKEAAKKKERKKMQKQAKDEEKAKKEAEKAAQEAAARALEERKLDEQRQRKEEQRKKRETEKKAAEEERLRKEIEKQRKVQEERERQQELERKQREAKEKEKKKREEARKREREEKEAKEREARERRVKEEQERKAQETQAKRDKATAATAEKEARDRAKQEEQARQNAKRPPIAIPPGIHAAHPSMQSPQFQVATPIVPAKAPTPARHRQSSQQGPQSHSSSPRSQQAATTETTLSSTPSSISIAIPNPSAYTNAPGKQQSQGPPLHHPQPSAPLSPLSTQNRSSQPPHGYTGMPMPGPSTNGAVPTGLGMLPGTMPPMSIFQGPPVGGPHRGYGPPNGMPFPPGMNGNRQFAQGPSGHFPPQPSMVPPIPNPPKQPVKPQTHSRQQSTSHDSTNESVHQLTPISRPPPTGQSPNSTPDKKENRKVSDPEVEHLATQLGSKALLDDSDIPLNASNSDHLSLPGAPGSGRAPFSNFLDAKHDAFQPGHWGGFSPNGNFAGPPNWGAPGLTPKQSGGWPSHHQPSTNAFGIIGGGVHASHRPHASRPVAIRLMVAEACKKLSATPGTSADGFHPAKFLLRQVEQMKPPHEPVITLNEMLEICDTEGNSQNGGGSFIVRNDGFQGQSVRFEPSSGTSNNRAVGDIGSPMVAHSQLATFGGIGQPISGASKGH